MGVSWLWFFDHWLPRTSNQSAEEKPLGNPYIYDFLHGNEDLDIRLCHGDGKVCFVLFKVWGFKNLILFLSLFASTGVRLAGAPLHRGESMRGRAFCSRAADLSSGVSAPHSASFPIRQPKGQHRNRYRSCLYPGRERETHQNSTTNLTFKFGRKGGRRHHF